MNTPSEQLPKGYSPLFWKAFTTQRKKPEKKRKKIKKVLDRGGRRCYINEAVRRGRAAEKRPAGKKALDKRACGMVI